jgi:hypothetical protein
MDNIVREPEAHWSSDPARENHKPGPSQQRLLDSARKYAELNGMKLTLQSMGTKPPQRARPTSDSAWKRKYAALIAASLSQEGG